MTRLMVLGGGRHQVPLIQRAEERGIETVLVDYLPDAPGREFASHSELADATDTSIAVELASKYAVDGVVTTGTDIPIRTMAAVADALQLPHYLTPSGARSATDKLSMFETLSLAGVPMARRFPSDQKLLPHAQLPVVVKPADSQGQRGMALVEEAGALSEALGHARKSSRTGRVLIEEYMTGPEFTANAWLQDGGIAMMLVNDRITFNPSPYLGIAFQHRHPSLAAAGWEDRVRDITLRTARSYGVETGPLYIQMIATADGPRVVEAAARIGGGHESRLIWHMTGWSSDDALIDLALGSNPTSPPAIPPDSHMLVNFVLGSEGIVGDVGQLPNDDGVLEAGWYVKKGDQLGRVVDSLGRVGYFVASAGSMYELERVADDFYRKLLLPDGSGRNLVQVPPRESINRP